MCQSTITPAPAWGTHPYQRAHNVAQVIGDARYLAVAIAELVPEGICGIRIDDLTRLQHFAGAVARLMESAAEDCHTLASDLQDLHIANQGV